MPTMNDANGNPITPFSKEYFERERAISDFKAAHPWGSDVSAHPGFLGKIGHVLAKVGNIAGDIVAPGVMENIPGTDLHNNLVRRTQQLGENEAVTNEEKEAQAKNLQSETALRNAPGEKLVGEPKQDPNSGNWFQAAATKDAQGNEVVNWKPLAGGPTGGDELKRPVGADYATQFGQQLGTLTAGMSPADQQKFAAAYGIKPTDTGAVAEKRLADAKAAAQMTGAERDRAVQRAATEAQQAETNRMKEEELKLHQEAAATAAGKGSTDVVRAYDKDGVVHLTSEGDAKEKGYTNATKATQKQIDDANTHATVLNDMQAKLNNVVESSGALNQNEAQRTIIAKALASPPHTTVDALIQQGLLNQATAPTKEYIQSVLSLRESSLGLPKEITGGSRVSEIQASALWETLPSAASLDKAYAIGQSKKFQANIDRLWKRVSNVEGMPHEEPNEEIANEPAAKPAAAATGGNGGAPAQVPTFQEHIAKKRGS